MKRPNKHVTRVVTSTLATSILLASCEADYMTQRDFQIYKPHGNLKIGETAISINRTLAEQQYLIFLHKLSCDIINNPTVASSFVSEPSYYCQMYGYNQPVNLDEGMLKLILALGDTDVNLAIHNNDIKSLITLLKNKNLLVQPSNTFMSITEQQKDEILSLLGLSSEIENSRIPVVAVVALVWLWVGVYAQAVAINQAVAAVNVAAVGVVVTWIKAWSILDKTAYQGFLEENPFLRIYGLKTEESNTYIAADTYLEQFVSEVADGLETNYPSAFDEMPKDKFMQVLKLNIINNQ